MLVKGAPGIHNSHDGNDISIQFAAHGLSMPVTKIEYHRIPRHISTYALSRSRTV